MVVGPNEYICLRCGSPLTWANKWKHADDVRSCGEEPLPVRRTDRERELAEIKRSETHSAALT
jgi:hypothetical protein